MPELIDTPPPAALTPPPVEAPPVNELAEFRARKSAEPVADPPPSAPPPPAAVADDEPVEQASAPATSEKPVVSKRQQYINDLIRAQTTAELRAQQLEQELATLRTSSPQTPTAATDATGKPQLEGFETYEAYIEALTDWKTDQKLAAHRAQQTTTQIQATFNDRMAAARKKYPDFEEVLRPVVQTRIPPHLNEALMYSDLAGELGYYFGTHAEELQALLTLSPILAVKGLGAIEARLAASLSAKPPALPKTSAAPPPVTPVVAATAPGSYDAATATLAQFRAKHRRRA